MKDFISTKAKKVKSKRKEFVIFEIEELREHEEIRPDYLEALKNEIQLDGILKMPICIDKNTCIILDGHHRLHALKRLGCKKIPCVLVDYQSPEIKVIAWREGETMTKEKIIDTALSGKRMPSKTSKHMILLNGEWKHISAIQMLIDIPLEKLK
jgi:uncharacterized protein (DUF1015 family)